MPRQIWKKALWIFTAIALAVAKPSLRADDSVEADEKFLQHAHVGTDGPALMAFIRSRSLTEADRLELEKLIVQLGDASFRQREAASQQLVKAAAPAVPLLRKALVHPDREISRRAEFCLEEIERGPGAALPAAAVRLIGVRKPKGAVSILLTYLPYNDDEGVEDEILAALTNLGAADGKIDPALSKALGDSQASRRAAAAYVAGRATDTNSRAAVRELLGDVDAKVRLRAAQGLIGARDKTAIPILVGLLTDVPLPVSWQAEELLCRIARQKSPSVSIGGGDAAVRKHCRDAWTTWWRDEGSHVDLAGIDDKERMLGLTVVAELDSNRVWECGPDGQARWKLSNLLGPIDVQILNGGRVLIAENSGQRVTERDLKGNILWEKQLPGQNPIACQRLPNGNTFIASYQNLLEVNREGKEIFNFTRGNAFFIFGARKLSNGHIVYISGQGSLHELDANRKEIHSVHIATNGGWCGIQGLANNHYLVALAGSNKVAEVDANGKTVWQCTTVMNPCSATRLPNGNTLVTSMHNRVVEVDRQGKTVWQKTTDGRPFKAYRR